MLVTTHSHSSPAVMCLQASLLKLLGVCLGVLQQAIQRHARNNTCMVVACMQLQLQCCVFQTSLFRQLCEAQGLPAGHTEACYPVMRPGVDSHRAPPLKDADAEKREVKVMDLICDSMTVKTSDWTAVFMSMFSCAFPSGMRLKTAVAHAAYRLLRLLRVITSR